MKNSGTTLQILITCLIKTRFISAIHFKIECIPSTLKQLPNTDITMAEKIVVQAFVNNENNAEADIMLKIDAKRAENCGEITI